MVSALTHECAARVMETIPLVMRSIRAEMHTHRTGELSVAQFRALMTVKRHGGASLSLVSNHLGASLSATSKLIDGLVERQYVSREDAADDRRRVLLALTALGEQTLESVRHEAVAYLSERLSGRSQSECSTIIEAMALLRAVFAPTPELKAEATEKPGEPICG